MKRASIGVCCVLLGCMLTVGGTLAKYTQSFTTGDTARVAEFKFTSDGFQEEQAIKLFSTSYNSGKVQASNDDKVVAPGASGRMTYKVRGTAETDCLIQIGIDEQNDSNIPIVYWIEDKSGQVYGYYSSNITTMSITSEEYANMVGVSWTDVENDGTKYTALVGTLDNFKDTLSLAYYANESASIEFTIGWKWLYDRGTLGDQNDTSLGTNALDKEIDVTVSANVMQANSNELDSCPSWQIIKG